jgi:hypothetical protein
MVRFGSFSELVQPRAVIPQLCDPSSATGAIAILARKGLPNDASWELSPSPSGHASPLSCAPRRRGYGFTRLYRFVAEPRPAPTCGLVLTISADIARLLAARTRIGFDQSLQPEWRITLGASRR